MQRNHEEKFELLYTLNMTTAFNPIAQKTDILCILGATFPSMQGRFNYATSLVEKGLKVKQIVLSLGERYANNQVDGPLENIAIYHNLFSTSKVTETHLIKYIFEHSYFNNLYPTYVIDTPKGELSRPSTLVAMIDLVNWLK